MLTNKKANVFLYFIHNELKMAFVFIFVFHFMDDDCFLTVQPFIFGSSSYQNEKIPQVQWKERNDFFCVFVCVCIAKRAQLYIYKPAPLL